LIICCAVEKVPFPAFETLNERIRLPRRFFLFFDLFFRVGRHNREWWKNATSTTTETGQKTQRFGTPKIEAHIKTTICENYFRWMFQVLSDSKCMPDPDMAYNFKTEYDYEHQQDLPADLACTLSPLARLPKNCEIIYDPAEDEEDQDGQQDEQETRIRRSGSFTIFTEQKDEQEYRNQQRIQRQIIFEMASKYGKDHKHLLELMRRKVREVRGTPIETNSESIKRAISETKNKLRLYGNDDETPKKKKRRSGSKSRCSEKKLRFFDENKESVDREEEKGYRKAWENMYKEIMNKHVTDDSDDEEDEAPLLKFYLLKNKELEVTAWDEI
jgi:hypothetical protein